MKNKKKDIILLKYKKIQTIKNKIKNKIKNYFFQNQNLSLKFRQVYKLVSVDSIKNSVKKKNICLFSGRKRSLNRTLNLGRHKVNKLLKTGKLDFFFIN